MADMTAVHWQHMEELMEDTVVRRCVVRVQVAAVTGDGDIQTQGRGV